MRQILFIALLSLFVGSTLQGQALHYTYWDHLPLAVNPAMAGSYEGTIRASGIHRSQFTWQTWADLGGEYNLPFRPRKKDWITASLAVAQDISGSLGLSYQEFRIGGTYHLALDKKVTSDLALGVQFVSSSTAIGLEGDNLTRVQLSGAADDPDIRAATMGNMAEGLEANASWGDLRIGLAYTKRSQKGQTQFGIQGANILSPEAAVSSGNRLARLDLRIGGFFLMDRMINKKISVLPALFAQFQGPASEIMARAMIGYSILGDDNIRLKAGLGYRLGNIGDTGQLVFGGDYQDWKFGLAFDVITSQRITGGGQALGAVELSAMKTFIIRKKPKVKPVIFCPRI